MHSPGIKKRHYLFALAAVLILIVPLAVLYQPDEPRISGGRRLPPGKVQPQLLVHWDTAVLLAPDGSLWGWGGAQTSLTNMIPNPGYSQIPRRIGSDSDWTQVDGDGTFMLGLKADGSLWVWGWNEFGATGQTNLTGHDGVPTRIGTDTDWSRICASGDHSLALKKDGSLWGWGFNGQGQLGDGTTNNQSAPVMIGTNRDWRMISTGEWTTLALKTNGTLWSWGLADDLGHIWAPRQLDASTNWAAISAFSMHSLALKTDGTLWLMPGLGGSSTNLTQWGQDGDWSEMHTGTFSFFARKRDGSWWASGQNHRGQLGLGPNHFGMVSLPERLPFDFEPWAVGPGEMATVELGKDGRLWSWGRRLGAEKTSEARRKIQILLWPLATRVPALRMIYRSDTDQTPHLLWELPPEVRRSLGTGLQTNK